MKSKHYILLISIISFILTNCSGLIETFNETGYLYDDIQEQYGDEGNLSVQHTIYTGIGKAIKIEWENSNIFSPDDPEIENKSIELALFVREHYAGIDEVDKVWIVLTKRQGFIVNIDQTVSFVYDLDELEAMENN